MGLYAEDVGIIQDIARDLPRPLRVLSFAYPTLVDDPQLTFESVLPGDAEFVSLDQKSHHGTERLGDLNYPVLEASEHGKYQLVIDPGTIEHVFNIGQALVTALQAMAVGGVAFHVNPLGMPNHGYWNISPLAFHDFYTSNGCEILRMDALRKGKRSPIPMVDKFKGASPMLSCITKKAREVSEITFPIQRKYQ